MASQCFSKVPGEMCQTYVFLKGFIKNHVIIGSKLSNLEDPTLFLAPKTKHTEVCVLISIELRNHETILMFFNKQGSASGDLLV